MNTAGSPTIPNLTESILCGSEVTFKLKFSGKLYILIEYGVSTFCKKAFSVLKELHFEMYTPF